MFDIGKLEFFALSLVSATGSDVKPAKDGIDDHVYAKTDEPSRDVHTLLVVAYT